MDLIKKYLENGFEILGQEKKYNVTNRFGPKKLPDQAIKRSDIPLLYSWNHYAPLEWFNHFNKHEENVKNAQENKGQAALFNLCSYCSAPES